jgi:methylenetetrahydrofolate dehydrogenase (NADP+) / methenyltetrahydrofolate cyclohydrolase
MQAEPAMVKPGAVLLDVDMTRNLKGKLCGGVDYEGVNQLASYIAPVPSGVGSTTIASLLRITEEAADRTVFELAALPGKSIQTLFT